MSEFLSVKDIAASFGVSVEVVLNWIHGGQLRAVDVSRDGCTRPRWKIAAEALEAFKESRFSNAPESKPATRQRKQKADYVKYFSEN